MKAFRCVPVVLIVLGATLTGVWLLEPGQGKGYGSMWEARGALAGLEREKEELDHLALLLNHRSSTLTEITADVIAGRLGLLEAAAGFHAADAGLPSRVPLKDRFAGASDGERECRRVIGFVEEALEEEPSRRAAVVDRLEAELQAQLRQHGTVRLPESDSAQARSAPVEHSEPVPGGVH
jgi:hypothetical protein